MHDELTKNGVSRNRTGAYATSATLFGFLLFLTGAILVLVGMLDILVRIDSLRTALYLVIGLAMYKLGHSILNHFATLRTERERRKSHAR
ncbi:hypothetical protein [Alteromonas sp. CYL-A6]|uniref:hypothetical protein n=1 Tax=Alteromonas nitratireducens TaxID=3390813 RepID=UPI0034B3BE33